MDENVKKINFELNEDYLSQTQNHWRNLMDKNHFRAEMLYDKEGEPFEVVLTISDIKKEDVVSSGGNVSQKPVAYFEEEGVLPLVLNATICTAIEKAYKTGSVLEWIGKKIQLYPYTTSFGKNKNVPCVRVRDFAPEMETAVYHCSHCGKEITYKTYRLSIKKYGKAYCSGECLAEDTKGKQIL